MKKSLSLILALTMVFTMFASVAFAADPATTTAPATVTGTTYTPQEAFDALVKAGIVVGDDVKGANLDANLTRAEFSKILANVFELKEDTAGSTVYTDLVGATWAKGYIGAATKAGLLNGVGGGKFNPSGNVKLEEIATVISKAFKLDTSAAYAGAGKVDKWAKGYVGAVIKANLVADSADFTKAAKRSEIFTISLKGYITYQATKVPATPAPTPVATSKAFDLSTASALNSKVVEVVLATAAAAGDLTATNASVKDAAGTAVSVTSVAAAPYSTDGKTVLVTLGTDTAVGVLYTITSGAKSINFGGRAVDKDKPTVASVASTDYNKVKIVFNEAVSPANATLTLSEKYGAAAALAVTDVKATAKDTLVFTTADQKSLIYGINLTNVADYAGNKMDSNTTATFVGKIKPTENQVLGSAKATDYNKIVLKFNTKVDPASLAASTYLIEEAYGTKTAFTATAATAVRADAGDFDSSLTTDVTKDDLLPYLVVLNISAGSMKDSQLYKVTVTGVNTLYGKPMSGTAGDTSKTFNGMAKPSTSFAYTSIVTKSNTSLEVKYERNLDKASANNVANYAIALANGTKAALAVKSATLKDDNKTVTLVTGVMVGDIYRLTTTNLKDAYGNSVKTGTDAEKTFVGQVLQAKIDGITSITRSATDADTNIVVKFNKNIGPSANDVSHYSIDNGIGYPTKAVTVDGTSDSVTLTIPKTIDAKSYTLTVKGLENADLVAQGDAITATFAGRGLSATLPALDSAYAVDKNTLVLYFDRPVSDGKIDNVIWTSSNNQLATNALYMRANKSGTSATALVNGTSTLAYKDPSNENALIVRVDGDNAVNGTLTSAFASDSTFSSFLITFGTGIKAKFTSDTATNLEVAAAATDTAKVDIENAQGIDNQDIKVYFSVPVAAFGPGAFTIVKKSNGANVAINTVTVVPGTNDQQYLINTTGAALFTNDSYELRASSLAAVHAKYLTDLTLKPDTTGGSTVVREFAGNANADNFITNIYGVQSNKNTITVFYPENMLVSASNVAAVTNHADSTTAYSLLKKDGVTPLTSAPTIVDVEYDAANNKATLYLSGAITDTNTTDGSFDVVVNTNVPNLTGNKTVAASSTDNSNLKVEVARSTTDVTPTIASATVTSDRMSIDIVMSEQVAFATTAAWGTAGGTFTAAQFPTKDTTGEGTQVTATQLLNAFKITGKFGGSLTARDAVAGDIASIARNKDGKKITVTFTTAITSGTDGTVTTEPSIQPIINKSSIAAKTGSNKSSVPFSATSATIFDSTAPTVASATYAVYGTDGTTKLLKVVFSEEVQDGTINFAKFSVSGGVAITAALATNASGDVANDNTIYLTVNNNASGQTLTVTPSAINDLAGNPTTATFTPTIQ